jgi:hypothetical protein
LDGQSFRKNKDKSTYYMSVYLLVSQYFLLQISALRYYGNEIIMTAVKLATFYEQNVWRLHSTFV